MNPTARFVVCAASIGTALSSLSCAAAPAPTVATLQRAECRVQSPRVPAVLAKLPWVLEIPPTNHVFSGEAIASAPAAADADESSSWAVTGGIYLTLREIDLNGDGRCDLVATAQVAISTGGDSSSNLVFWFATPQGWRRQGADWGARSAGLNPMAIALLAPDTPADFARYGYGLHVPVKLADGRVVLAVRPAMGRGATTAGPVTVLAFDKQAAAMQPLPEQEPLARLLGELADRICVEERSEDEACLMWFN